MQKHKIQEEIIVKFGKIHYWYIELKFLDYTQARSLELTEPNTGNPS